MNLWSTFVLLPAAFMTQWTELKTPEVSSGSICVWLAVLCWLVLFSNAALCWIVFGVELRPLPWQTHFSQSWKNTLSHCAVSGLLQISLLLCFNRCCWPFIYGSKPVQVCPVSVCVDCVLDSESWIKPKLFCIARTYGIFFLSVCVCKRVRSQCCWHSHSELLFSASVGVAVGRCPLEWGQLSGSVLLTLYVISHFHTLSFVHSLVLKAP